MRLHEAIHRVSDRPLAAAPAVLMTGIVFYLLLAGCGGGEKTQTSNETSTTPAQTTPSPAETAATAAGSGDVAEGKQIYMAKCTPCHGPEGKGNGPLAASLNVKPRNHTDGVYMRSRTDDQLLEVIRNGKPPMPPWKGVLSDQQIHSALKYVRTLAR